MNEQIERLREGFRAQLDAANSPTELDAVRVAYLGKKGPVSDLMKGLRDMTDEERRRVLSRIYRQAKAGYTDEEADNAYFDELIRRLG